MIKETQSGNTAKAIENYMKFLDFWKDTNPSIHEVEDARKVGWAEGSVIFFNP